MAQAHRAHAGAGKRCESEDRHGIGVVEHPGLWAELFCIVQNVEPGGASAQRFEDASWAACVANTLIDAILHRNIEVMAYIGETSDLNGVDDEIAPCQQFASLG